MNNKVVCRGEVWYTDLGNPIGSEQGGVRPVLIMQNDTGNQYSTTTIVLSISSSPKEYDTSHVQIPCLKSGSYVMCEQIRTIDKLRLERRVGILTDEKMEEISKKLREQLCL